MSDRQNNNREIVIGTDATWSNALVVTPNPAWAIIAGASFVVNAQDPANPTVVISRTFTLPENRRIQTATLTIAVDNYASVLINGLFVVNDNPQDNPLLYNPGRTFDITRFLNRGANNIVIVANNFGGPPTPTNPVGVAARLNITTSRKKD
ncbi:MAG: hypothetical protein P0Y55_15975 [Candidatus Cohnella colombiensis]|uniref:Glycosyl hydrolases family 2 sugar binding domain-containing protein n=1 Tax=Candidatus Cohnella colombiensis TaxID=3121368 RepID=A0AA95JA71_9BACL|nr:MAG: hypothetical protein P0Y55_15975 [Cohnella sp.]